MPIHLFVGRFVGIRRPSVNKCSKCHKNKRAYAEVLGYAQCHYFVLCYSYNSLFSVGYNMSGARYSLQCSSLLSSLAHITLPLPIISPFEIKD